MSQVVDAGIEKTGKFEEPGDRAVPEVGEVDDPRSFAKMRPPGR